MWPIIVRRLWKDKGLRRRLRQRIDRQLLTKKHSFLQLSKTTFTAGIRIKWPSKTLNLLKGHWCLTPVYTLAFYKSLCVAKKIVGECRIWADVLWESLSRRGENQPEGFCSSMAPTAASIKTAMWGNERQITFQLQLTVWAPAILGGNLGCFYKYLLPASSALHRMVHDVPLKAWHIIKKIRIYETVK